MAKSVHNLPTTVPVIKIKTLFKQACIETMLKSSNYTHTQFCDH